MIKLHAVAPVLALVVASGSATKSCDSSTGDSSDSRSGTVTFRVGHITTPDCHKRVFAPCPVGESFELEITNSKGKRLRFGVSKTTYMRCRLHMAYPACSKGAGHAAVYPAAAWMRDRGGAR